MSEQIKFSKELILRKKEETGQDEILLEMAKLLKNKGFVKETYGEALLQREKEYPTGLETGETNVAIPHVDIKHVNSAAIAVGILEKPIEFHKMEEPEKSVNVGIIIMLALDKPHAHIDMLGKIIEMIKNKEVLKDIINEKNEENNYKIISKYLL